MKQDKYLPGPSQNVDLLPQEVCSQCLELLVTASCMCLHLNFPLSIFERLWTQTLGGLSWGSVPDVYHLCMSVMYACSVMA